MRIHDSMLNDPQSYTNAHFWTCSPNVSFVARTTPIATRSLRRTTFRSENRSNIPIFFFLNMYWNGFKIFNTCYECLENFR